MSSQNLEQKQKNYEDLPLKSGFSASKIISTGSTADIYLIENETKDQQYVLKKYSQNQIIKDIVKNEAEILQEVQSHKNIMELVDIQENALAFEYCQHGDLYNYVTAEKFSEELAKFYFSSLLDALTYLHNNQIAHRDIKLENILLSQNFELKLADFGYSEKYHESKQLENLGTVTYMAPEMFFQQATSSYQQSKNQYDLEKIDVFAAGIVLFSLVMGFPPYQSKACPNDPFYKFFWNKKQPKYWKALERKLKIEINPDFIDLINQMIEPNPVKRISLSQIQEHDWVQKTSSISQQSIITEMTQRKEKF